MGKIEEALAQIAFAGADPLNFLVALGDEPHPTQHAKLSFSFRIAALSPGGGVTEDVRSDKERARQLVFELKPPGAVL